MSETLTEPSTSVSPEEVLKCMECIHCVADAAIDFTLRQSVKKNIGSIEELLVLTTDSLKRCGAHAIRNGDVITCPIVDNYGDPES